MNEKTKGWLDNPFETYDPEKLETPFCKAITAQNNLPELPPMQIEDLLRRGGMMLLTGASKIGKSFNLIELSVALATSAKWLDFPCQESRVLYINLEIQAPSFHKRVYEVTKAMDADEAAVQENLTIWNARGEHLTITEIEKKFIEWDIAGNFDAIVIDPLYKVQAGSENDAESINRFFNTIDAIAQETGASVIMCHHHSKGSQMGKAAIDRSSGSGVFGRAADVLIDFTEYPSDKIDFEAKQEAHALRDAVPLVASFIVRDFKSPESFGAWFRYPIHEKDGTGLIDIKSLYQSGSSGYRNKAQTEIDEAVEKLIEGKESITRKELENETGKDRKTINKYLESSTLFERKTVDNNRTLITRKEAD